MEKRWTALLAAAVLALPLTACGTTKNQPYDVTRQSRTSAQQGMDRAIDNGEYRAGSDGSVAPGSGNWLSRDLDRLGKDVKRGSKDLIEDGKHTMDDMVRDTENAMK